MPFAGCWMNGHLEYTVEHVNSSGHGGGRIYTMAEKDRVALLVNPHAAPPYPRPR